MRTQEKTNMNTKQTDGMNGIDIERDAIDEYFECITACSISDNGMHCITQCVDAHLKKEPGQ